MKLISYINIAFEHFINQTRRLNENRIRKVMKKNQIIQSLIFEMSQHIFRII